MEPLPRGVVEPKTVRLRSLELATKALPKAISGFEGKTVRLRPLDLPVIGAVANTVRQQQNQADARDVPLGGPARPGAEVDVTLA
ncbi:MAG TPA: hypothetical protein VHH12_04580, partial [Mycobacterium sp.]|nr:hypothetical protein [Mycobacterium sp.]